MSKITMLGTGNGGTLDIYNTCFVIQNDNGSFLVDTGGSIEVAKRIRDLEIDLYSIKDIFISHSHNDHIFGFLDISYFLFKIKKILIIRLMFIVIVMFIIL